MTIALRLLARLGLFTPAAEDTTAARYAALSGAAAPRVARQRAPSPFRFSSRGNA